MHWIPKNIPVIYRNVNQIWGAYDDGRGNSIQDHDTKGNNAIETHSYTHCGPIFE